MNITEELKKLIQEGNELKPLGGILFKVTEEEKLRKYISWRIQVISAIESLGRDSVDLLEEINKNSDNKSFYQRSVLNFLSVLKVALSVAERKQIITVNNQKELNNSKVANSVFIVHGKDESRLQNLARFLEKIDIEPIILFERPGKGQTIIQKLESNSNVCFAIVLLTPDDLGRLESDKNEFPRARQNVILELGYFIGKLGRGNVGVLYDENVELPSDYRGVEYIKLDIGDTWKIKIVREMKEARLNIDMNKAF